MATKQQNNQADNQRVTDVRRELFSCCRSADLIIFATFLSFVLRYFAAMAETSAKAPFASHEISA
jgi:hypothetical protein